MWVHQLWPYSRDQDGAFVQLQALLPATSSSSATGGKSSCIGDQSSKALTGGRKDVTGRASAAAQGAAVGLAEQGAAPVMLSKLWFVRLGAVQAFGGRKARTPHELPADLSLLPSLLRS